MHNSGPSCNVTAMQALTQMDSLQYHRIKLATLCTSCILNMLLSIPLLLAITHSPSLLRHTRFLLLVHLLGCDSLQLILLTSKSALQTSRDGMPVAQCLVFMAAYQACFMVDLLLSTALAVDRCLAIRWPLHYDLLVCPRNQRTAVAAMWSVPILVCVGSLSLGLSDIEVNAALPRCRAFIFTPCLSVNSKLHIINLVVSGLLLPLCYLTILGCFFLLCWDTRSSSEILFTKRAGVTLGLQATQTLVYSVPALMNSPLLPNEVHHDSLDIVINTTYNLGISLIPLVYGYRSRELQKRLREAKPRNRVSCEGNHS